jgi:hypothetical protein
MKRDASDNARVASTREVDCWENEGGADRAPTIPEATPTLSRSSWSKADLYGSKRCARN